MKSIRLLAVSILAAACFFPATAFAAGDSTILLGVTSGFGGTFDGEWDSTLSLGSLEANFGDNINNVKMEPTWGGMFHYDVNLHQYFALGSRVSILGFTDSDRADDGWSRNTTTDIAVVPRLRFEIPETPVELYVAVPLGVSVHTASKDWKDKANLDFDWGYGFNISALLGARFSLSDSIGVFAEAGWSMHTVNFNGEVAGGLLIKGAEVGLNGHFNQFTGNAGVAILF